MCQTDHVTMLRSQDAFWNPKIRARTHPDPPGCSDFTFVNKLQNTQDTDDVSPDEGSREP